MNLIFLTLIDINNINESGIYQDLLRKFRDEGHNVYILSPSERRKKESTAFSRQEGVNLLKVKTLNIQKTNLLEKGIGTLLLEYQFLQAFKKYFINIKFDLVLYSTPPITLTKVITFIKDSCKAKSYLLLKDIFPQNAVDLRMLREGGLIHKYFGIKEKQLYKVSDFIGCMSPANVDYLIQHNPYLDSTRVEVNPNSITPNATNIVVNKNLVRVKYQIPLNATVFLYGGNLGKPQGIDFLLKVLDSNKNKEKVFFVIVGGGTDFFRIENWQKRTNPGNVMLMQNLPKKKYDELIKACDVGLIFLDKRFTIPNFPSRLLAYLENKMPVISATDPNTDIGKITEDFGCGFWVEAGELEKFNSKLDVFSENRELIKQMGQRSYQLLLQEYIVEISYNKIKTRIKEGLH